MGIDSIVRRIVRQRAGDQCEYCQCRQDELPLVTFHVEHIISKQHGGLDDDSNLCLSCHWCNFHKGPNLATHVDGVLVPLFNPRTQRWDEHFAHVGIWILGSSPVGRGTVKLLNMNDDDRRELRRISEFASK